MKISKFTIALCVNVCYYNSVVNHYNNLINVKFTESEKKKMLKIRQMKNQRSERPVANQFVLETSDFLIFQSYETLICAIHKTTESLFIFDYLNDLDVSRTTAKYLYQFLEQNRFNVKCSNEKLKNSSLPYYRKLEKIAHSETDRNVFYLETETFINKTLNI